MLRDSSSRRQIIEPDDHKTSKKETKAFTVAVIVEAFLEFKLEMLPLFRSCVSPLGVAVCSGFKKSHFTLKNCLSLFCAIFQAGQYRPTMVDIRQQTFPSITEMHDTSVLSLSKLGFWTSQKGATSTHNSIVVEYCPWRVPKKTITSITGNYLSNQTLRDARSTISLL
jgi:hypothetical protein